MKNVVKAMVVILGQMVVFNQVGQSENYKKSLLNSPALVFLGFVGLVFLFNYVSKLKTKTKILQKIVSLFFAITTWFMSIYGSGLDTVKEVIVSPVGMIYSILFVLSFYLLVETMQKILTYYYHKDEIIHHNRWFIRWFEAHSFLIPFILINLVWLLVAFSAYPSVFMGDSLDQLTQFFLLSTRTAAHPVISTISMGSYVYVGQLVSTANNGLFLYTVVQVVFVAFCVSYAIHVTYKLTRNSSLLLIIMVILAMIPMTNGTVILATKDIMFSGFFVLYMVSLITYFVDDDYYKRHHLYVMLFFSVFFMMLFRYNTLHFIGLTIVVYVFFGLVMRKKFYRLTSVTIMMILGLLVGFGCNTFLANAFAEEQTTPKRREMLSLPFQFTARYAKFHSSDVTEKERIVIDKVLDYNAIKENYDPYRSDVVKATHNESATKDEMTDYFNVVKKQIRMEPLTAVESVMASHSNLFNLNKTVNDYYSNGVKMSDDDMETMNLEKIGIHDNKRSLRLNKIRVRLYKVFDRLPVLAQLDNYAFYVFIMLAVFVLWLTDKQFYLAGLLIPTGAFIGTLIAGPITLGYIRYILAVVLVTPFLLVVALQTKKKPSLDLND